MSDPLEQTMQRLLADHCSPQVVAAAEGSWSAPLWERLEQSGFTTVGVPEDMGGSGGDIVDAATIVRLAARYAAPVPLAETILLAGWACEAAGLPLPAGPLTVAMDSPDAPLVATRTISGWTIRGTSRGVPWARTATRILAVAHAAGANNCIGALVDPAHCELSSGINLAGEPRDDVTFPDVVLSADAVGLFDGDPADVLRHRGALARALQIAGALEGTLELTIRYATERTQFGRPIGRFQAVQHQVALLAGEVAAVTAAADGAVRAVAGGYGNLAVAAAKIRAGMAAGTAARLAHQVHGAIGFTQEHPLHHLTRRLWAWREEYGSDEHWAMELGRVVALHGPEDIWALVTSTM
jgi:acyl-CoA dehydrogenase